MRLVEQVGGSAVDVYRGTNKEPHFTIVGAELKDLDPRKVREYLEGCDWTDRGAKGWIHPRVRCDDFMKGQHRC